MVDSLVSLCQCAEVGRQNESLGMMLSPVSRETDLLDSLITPSQSIRLKCFFVCLFVCLFVFFLNSVLRPFQDYFSSYETGQSVGGAKTGEPREKSPDTTASRTWLVSHVASVGFEPTPDTGVRGSSG